MRIKRKICQHSQKPCCCCTAPMTQTYFRLAQRVLNYLASLLLWHKKSSAKISFESAKLIIHQTILTQRVHFPFSNSFHTSLDIACIFRGSWYFATIHFKQHHTKLVSIFFTLKIYFLWRINIFILNLSLAQAVLGPPYFESCARFCLQYCKKQYVFHSDSPFFFWETLWKPWF